MSEKRFLIVNADDLGMTATVNEGIFAAHEEGIVTSTSLMVNQSAAPAAAEALVERPELGVGLHLDFGGRIYEAAAKNDSAFVLFPSISGKGRTPERGAVEEECRSQLARFRQLIEREPTHLDSHKHLHESEPARAAAEALAAELRVPLRNRGIRYERCFYGRDAISREHLTALIEALPPGWTEIGCHPAAGPVPTSSYDAERQIELATLRHPRVKNLLNVTSVQLCSFAQVNPR
jgi:chitin disaccharide deacetylase